MDLNPKIQEARDAGYSDAQIADYMGSKYQLPVQQARHAGYNDEQIVAHLAKRSVAESSDTPAIDEAHQAALTRAQGELASGRPELDIQVPPPPQQASPDTSVLPSGREALGALQGSTLKAGGGLTSLVADNLAPAAGGAKMTPDMRSQIMTHAQQHPAGEGPLKMASPEQSQAYFDQLDAQHPAGETAAYFADLEKQNAARRELPGMRAAGKNLTSAGEDVLQDTQPTNPGIVKRTLLSGVKMVPSLAAGVAGGLAAGPAGAVGAMSATSGGEAYADVMDNPKLSEGEKTQYALSTAGLSAVFNSIPVTRAFAPGVNAVRRFLGSLALNVPAQEANTIAQHVLDEKSGAGEPWNDQQWGQAIIDSAIQAGLFSGAHTITSVVKTRLEAKQKAQVDQMVQNQPDLQKEMFGQNDSAPPSEKIADTASHAEAPVVEPETPVAPKPAPKPKAKAPVQLREPEATLADKAKAAAAQDIAIKPTDKGFTLTVDGKPTASAYTTMEDAQAARADLKASIASGEINKKPEVVLPPLKKEPSPAELQREILGPIKATEEVATTPEKMAETPTEIAQTATEVAPKETKGELITKQDSLVADEADESLASGHMDATGDQSPHDAAIEGIKDEIKSGSTHAPNGAKWTDVISEIEKRKSSVTKSPIGEKGPIDELAHQAATSPHNELPAPTPAQTEAGNYQKGHLKLHGLDISIENPKGSIRSSKPGAVTPWQSTMQAHYGYIKGTIGKDKDHIDVFVGPEATDPEHTIFVFDQPKFNGAGFDEHKVMLGFDSLKEAKTAYTGSYDKAAQPMANAVKVSHFSMDEFKKWLTEGDHQQPASSFNPRVKTPVKAAEESSSVAPKSAANSNVVHSKNFTDLLVGLSRAPKGFSSLDVKTQRMMMSTVRDSIHDLKVRSTIVSSVPASVMDKLIGKKASSQLFLHDPSVLRNALSESKAGLSISVNRFFDALGKAPTSVRTELGSGLRSDNKEGGATGTGSLNLPRKAGVVAGGRAENTLPNGKPVSLDEERNAAVTANNADTLEGSGVATRSGTKVSSGKNLGGDSGKATPALNATDDRHSKKIISDFGEKLEGARKDYAARLRDAESKDVATVSLSESWPEPNYQKLLENGADPWAVSFMHAARDSVPTKPKKSWKLKGWAEKVGAIREISFKLANGDISVENAKTRLDHYPELHQLRDQIDLYNAVGHDVNIKGITLQHHSYGLYNGVQYSPPKRIWTVEKGTAATALSNFPRVIAHAETKEQAIEQFKQKVGSLTTEDQVARSVKFGLYSTRGSNEFYIGKKIGKTVVKIKTGFTDVKVARKYLLDNHDELVATLTKMKDVPYERRTQNSPRVGIDHRHGVDVTPDQFQEQFGFRGVQFGNYVENDQRQQDLNQAYDSLMDLAGVIDVPPRALSLNGQLGLAFGARGKGGKNAPAAHYERDRAVINLTKGAGAGSLAHEWFHGLDNYFAGKAGQKTGMVTLMAKAPDGIRPEVFEAFKGILRAVKNSDLMKRSLELDETRSKPYWSTMHELAARSFETYAIHKLQDAGASNDYLANVLSKEAWDAAAGYMSEETYPYPSLAETPAIRAAFDHFFNTIEHKENNGNVEVHDLAIEDRDNLNAVVKRASTHIFERHDIPFENRMDANDRLTQLKKMLDVGRLTQTEFVKKLSELHTTILNKTAIPTSNRGAEHIRYELQRAQDLGYLDPKGVAFAKWFIDKNPKLVDELAVLVRDPEHSKPGTNGTYLPIKKMMEIITATAKQNTAVHEMLHHLEQLMPPDMQAVIRNEYWTQLQEQLDNAIKNSDVDKVRYLDAAMKYNVTGDPASLKTMRQSLLDAEVPGSFYQYYNPTEFWAVNATHLLTNRYRVRDSRWGKIKNWLKEFLHHVRNVFGMTSYSPLLKALKDLFEGKGLNKTSGEMLDKNLMAKRQQDSGAPPKEPTTPKRDGAIPKEPTTWESPDKSRVDTFLYDWQDKHIDMKEVTKAIEAVKKGQLADAQDPYLGEELYHQRTAYRVKRFLDDELRPLLEASKAAGVSTEALEHYLWARHAPERNETIKQRNPDMENGSGMSTAESIKYMASLSPSDRTKLAGLAAKVDKIIDRTRSTLVGYGLESQSTVDMWKSAWQKYVPLHRSDFENESAYGIGQGFSVKGSSTKQALGSERPVANVLAEIAMQRERAVVRGEKNRVSLALFGLAKDNPNPDWWSTERLPQRRFLDQTGKVTSQVDPNWKNKDHVVVARYPNARGNIIERGVVFNERNPRALRMAQSLKNLDADQMSGILGEMAKVSRYVSAINTQYDPVFGAWNLGRDIQGGLMNATSTPIRHEKAKIIRYARQSIRGIWQDARARRHGEHPTSVWAQWFERMEKAGGTTGHRDLFTTSKDRADAIIAEFNKLDAGSAKRSFDAVKGFLSDYNLVCESAVRVAAFRTAIEKGLSEARAASISKNLTINFNRKGANGQQANALYSFFNARVQGTARLYETLRGPAGKTIIAGALLLGVIQAVMLAVAGYDDNDPPEFVKANNFVIPIGNGHYVLWNTPQEARPLLNMGRLPTEYAIRKSVQARTTVSNLFASMFDAFSPMGGSTPLQTISPTATDPVAALAENKQFTGSPIYREKQDPFDPTPGFAMGMNTSTALSKVVAQGINTLSGGTKYVAGGFSPTPDQIDYLLNVATGGPGRLISNTEQTIASAVTGDDMPLYKVPLLGKVFGTTNSKQSKQSRFYQLVKTGRENLAEINGRLGEQDVDTATSPEIRDAYLAQHPEYQKSVRAVNVEEAVVELKTERRLAATRGANRDKLHEFDTKITKLMDQALTAGAESE